MTNYNKTKMSFKPLKGKKVEADFNGGKISSEGGSLLLREIDQKLGLTGKAAEMIPDARDQSKGEHCRLQSRA